MRRLKIIHRTHYAFNGVVTLAPHRLLLRPREAHDLRIELSRLEISPAASIRWMRDEFDNSVAIATFAAPAQQLKIVSELLVQHFDEAPLDFFVADDAVHYPFTYDEDVGSVLLPFLRCQSHESQTVRSWIGNFWTYGQPIETYTLLARLCSGISRSLTYRMREEAGVQTATETLKRGVGSCRDFATLFLEAARTLGLAARFVSGYLNAPAADGRGGATHAWAEVYLPGVGWKGFDPTSGELVGNKHIAVAVGRLPDTVCPVSGSFFGPPGSALNVGVWVSEI